MSRYRTVVESDGLALVVEGHPASVHLALKDGVRQGAGTVVLLSTCGAWVQVNPKIEWSVSLLEHADVPE